MRKLKDFSAKDWLQLQPLIHGGKQVRNDLLLNVFLKTRPETLEKFLYDNKHLRGKNILLIVAFEQPEVLSFSATLAARHLADATVLVFDNSRKPEKRARNEQICREQNVAYLPLPPNPTRHANRSHGLAMTWVWHNVVTAIQPAVVGFIDHDIILLEETEMSQMLQGQPFYGVPNAGKWGWSLWAGYCFYDFGAVGSLPLNFLNDFSRGLDTGGRNWDFIYGRHDARRFKFAHWQMFDIVDPATGDPRPVEIIDGAWLHIAGASHREYYRQNSNFYLNLAKVAEEGANWPQLQARMGGPDKVRPVSTEVVVKSKRRRWKTIGFEEGAGITNIPKTAKHRAGTN